MGLTNIIAVLCPLLIFDKKKYIHKIFFIFLSLGFVFSVKLSFVAESIGAPYQVGYYIWIISFLTLAVGVGYGIVKE